MSEKPFLYDLVYHYLKAGIDMGFYKKGRFLRPIQEYCQLFDVAPSTVRLALQQLQDEDYITVVKGQPARVKKDFSEAFTAAQRKELSLYFSPRLKALGELNEMLSLVFPLLLRQGLLAASPPELDEMEHIASTLDVFRVQRIVDFFISMLKPLGNSITLHLVMDISVFSRFCGLWSLNQSLLAGTDTAGRLQKLMYQLLASRQQPDSLGFDRLLHEFCLPSQQFSVTEAFHCRQEEPQIPFHWKTYKGRTQYYFSVVSDMMRPLLNGAYEPCSLLPGVSELAEEYHVSEKTIRQAIRLLNNIGLAKTLNGIGTQVCPPFGGIAQTNWADSAVRKNVLRFFQGMQIIVITIKSISLRVFYSAAPQTLFNIRDCLKPCLVQPFPSTVLECFKLLIDACGLTAVREIYGQLFSLMPWGFSPLFMETLRLHGREWKNTVRQILKGIESANPDLFSSSIQLLAYQFFVYDKEIAVKYGFTEADSVITPRLI